MKKLFTTGLLILAGIFQSRASLAQWTFETSHPDSSGPFAAENGIFAGTSQASGFHAAANSTTYSSPDGAGSDHSYSSKNWSVNDYYQFTTSTLGYEDVKVSFEAGSTGSGPKNFDLAYSTDGSTFSIFTSCSILNYSDASNPSWDASMSATDAAFYALGFDLSSIAALNNQSTIYLRLIDHDTASAGGGTVSGGGYSRVDDFSITARPISRAIPEPSTFFAGALLGLPLVLQQFRRRHQSRRRCQKKPLLR